ncbi:hypothetical protein FOA52_005340 [Chlamydomonas sp. UWO 241]|nr:hypothetical protein FOA52_005340 [Chlamydomonas sp. UWO 241]
MLAAKFGGLLGAAACALGLWLARHTPGSTSGGRDAQQHEGEATGGSRKQERGVCVLSPAAVQLLVEIQPVRHVLVELLHPSAPASDGSTTAAAATANGPTRASSSLLPRHLTAAAAPVPQDAVRALWEDPASLGQAGGAPARGTVLVFAAEELAAAFAGARAATGAGYQRVAAVATGGVSPSQWSAAAHLTYIGRHGVAMLMGYTSPAVGADGAHAHMSLPHATLLDVRRHDERALYGGIPGSVHVPVEALASALSLAPDAFEAAHHFPKPSPDDLVIVYSRTGRRAAWGAQLASDAGLSRVLVYKHGSNGWRFDSSVKSYKEFSLTEGAGPQEPDIVPLEQPDGGAGERELAALGLLLPLPSSTSSEAG